MSPIAPFLSHINPLPEAKALASTGITHPAALFTEGLHEPGIQDVFSWQATHPLGAAQPPTPPPAPAPGSNPNEYRLSTRLHEEGYPNFINFRGAITEESGEAMHHFLLEAWRGYLKPDGQPDTDKLAKEPLHFLIGSPGGSVSSTLRVTQTMDWLKEQGLHIITYAHDQVASAAAVLFAHGAHRVMSPSANMVLHESRLGFIQPYYPLTQLSSLVDLMKHVNDLAITDLFKTLKPTDTQSLDLETLKQHLQIDQYINAQKAKQMGLVDEIGFYKEARPIPPSDPRANKTKSSAKPPAEPETIPAPEPDPSPVVPPDEAPTPQTAPDASDGDAVRKAS